MISDFSSNVRELLRNCLPQEYALRYDETYWNMSINVKKNQALTFDHIDYYKPYERVPQITFNGYNATSTASRSARPPSDEVRASPTFTTGYCFAFSRRSPIRCRAVVPKGTFLGTWYQLENLDRDGGRFTNKDPHHDADVQP